MIKINIFRDINIRNNKVQWCAYSEDTNKDYSDKMKFASNFSYVSENEALGALIFFLLRSGYTQLDNLKIVEGL